MNILNYFTTKNPEIIRLYNKKVATSGKFVTWEKIDTFTCSSMKFKDDYQIEIQETGWYQVHVNLAVESLLTTNDITSFLAALQVNYKPSLMYYIKTNWKPVQISNCDNINFSDVLLLNKGDVVDVSVGEANTLQNDTNKFTIMKINL